MMPIPKAPRAKQENDSGFTLIELMVVLVILALTLGLSVPAFWNSRGSAQLRPLAAQLAAELKLARTTAIVQNRPVAFVFDPKAKAYQVRGVGQIVRLPASIGLTLVTSQELARGGDAKLVFFPDGSSTGGRLILFDRKGGSVTIQVEWLTGAVTSQRHA